MPGVRGVVANPILMGSNNQAGSANTQLTANTSGRAFEVIQNGSGAAIRGKGLAGNGGNFVTAAWNKFAFMAQHDGTGTGSGGAVSARGKLNHGLVASTDAASRYAVSATNTAGSFDSGAAVYADGNANYGVVGVSSSYPGVYGSSSSGYGVSGYSSTNRGVTGGSASGPGVYGASQSGYGVYGSSASNIAVYGQSTTNWGVRGGSAGSSGIGVYGIASGQYGEALHGHSDGSSGHGVVGHVTANSSSASAVWGVADYSAAYAGYFSGNVTVTGTLSKGGGSFRIDHPLDPARKILQHSFVESPDMLNIYSGMVETDTNGEASIELPAWFEALNRDVRYSLTPIGEFAPVFVKAKVAGGHFTIAGAKPNQEVSWQLTGIRRDAWAEAHRIEVELVKPANEQGTYLHPVEHGQPESAGVDYRMRADHVERL